ncbi:MAG: ATPase, T2SS/T4P/T4SS family [Phycisphaerae bacterium]
MPTLAWVDLLAQLPQSTLYVSPFKLAAMVVMFAIWAAYAGWVDKDTVAVNTFRVIWNAVTMSSGIVAVILLLFLPIFWAGLAAFAVINLAVATVYIIHRNGLVEETDKVMTAAHLSRVMSQGFSGKKKGKQIEVKERVRITDAGRKVVPIPEEDEARETYRLTQDLLFEALFRRASVVDLSPAGQATKVNYQIDGVTAERDPLLRPAGDGLVTFFKTIAGLNLEEKRKPQTGKIMIALGDQKYDVGVKTDGSTAGEKLSLRVIGAEKSYKIADIGMTEQQAANFKAEIIAPEHGLVIVSAPPANGLTTAVYAVARSHDAFLLNIQTLETAKDLDLENITQHVFVPEGEKTLAGELQKIVRTDPDVIIVPDMRDRAAATIAAQAAIEKQKVYVGIVANDVLEALGKWIQLVGDQSLVAKSLLAVMNGRLVRTLCTACKQPYKPEPAKLQKMNMPADAVLHRPPEPQVDKHGNPIICQNCQGSGYMGRTGVYTMFVADDGLRQVIRKGGTMSDIQATLLKKGGLGFQAQALQKVVSGVTSIEEVARVASAKPVAPKPPPAGPASTGKAAPAKAAPSSSPSKATRTA